LSWNYFKLIDAYKKADEIYEIVTKSLASHMSRDQSVKINTSSIVLSIYRLNSTNYFTELFEGLGKIKLPEFCDIVKSALKNPNSNCIEMNIVLRVFPLLNSFLNHI